MGEKGRCRRLAWRTVSGWCVRCPGGLGAGVDLGCGLRVVGCGLWMVGLWVVGCGLWVVGCGLWVVGCGLWVVGCGLWVWGVVLGEVR